MGVRDWYLEFRERIANGKPMEKSRNWLGGGAV